MLDHDRLPSASTWTRLLLGSLAITVLGLAVVGFLTAILGAAGDSVGHFACSSLMVGLLALVAAECVALVTIVAVRQELDVTR